MAGSFASCAERFHLDSRVDRISCGVLAILPHGWHTVGMSALGATGTKPDIRESILEAIGDTPLVRLGRIGAGLRPQLVAKVESLNPGGSIKDRVAVSLIEAAERDGRLQAGGTIVEP